MLYAVSVPGPCESSPCHNGGECESDGQGQIKCTCPGSFTGEYCEIGTLKFEEGFIPLLKDSKGICYNVSSVTITNLIQASISTPCVWNVFSAVECEWNVLKIQ